MRFDGKVVVVTGAERGIGRGIALAFANRGASLVVDHASTDASRRDAHALEAELKSRGTDVLVVEGDVRNSSDVDRVFDSVDAHFGPLDVLVNNAAIYPRGLVAELDDAAFDDTLAVNLRGTFVCSRAAIRRMIPKGRGRIVNVASGAAFAPWVRGAHYAASKSGMLGFTRALALEVATHGITVNAVAPGLVDTDQSRQELDDAAFQRLAREIPLGRTGTPEDIAAAVLFFASELAPWITGQTLLVNGGRYMR